jgi:hypothetical protein
MQIGLVISPLTFQKKIILWIIWRKHEKNYICNLEETNIKLLYYIIFKELNV